jgi:hypothetical protein
MQKRNAKSDVLINLTGDCAKDIRLLVDSLPQISNKLAADVLARSQAMFAEG